ncbi:RNA polymerase sigma-70 factor, ECF subfamily [Flagellimonas zhangzhouensis]|uniref:RNA polymerase sigma-70 factor, ECF subfamily n=1 Tax=Flagellimonas zhangzhouensis TaxID=1073328 RepID=A0A1H2YXM2_9FLAO|nr:RNA polymerase sigma-70 factor, ECF subfamily [Allomuricauda zhangzhouensis]SDX09309.1 RNA polymerase sigma-70 factor, ECF subfamily [Allomuricauda zhangzhouensis]
MTFLKHLFLILISNPDKKFLETEDLYAHLSDEELVKQIVATNDPLLFGKLYDRYAKMVYNKCYGFAKSDDEAEDLTQDVFLQLFIKLRTFKGKSKFSTWLYSFTYNFCVNYVNRNKQRKMNDQSVQVDDSEHKLTEEIPDQSLYQMKTDKLQKSLELISAEDKSILLLKYQDGASIKDLVHLMDIGESAAKMRLKRAKERLVEIYNTLD